MKSMSRLSLVLGILLVVASSVGNSRYPQRHRGNVVESIADPRVATHGPRLHHPFHDRQVEFSGPEQVPGVACVPQAQSLSENDPDRELIPPSPFSFAKRRGSEGVEFSIFKNPLQVWVIDTALAYSTSDTMRHRYEFNGQAKMTMDWAEQWTNNQWANSWRWSYTYDTNGKMLTFLYEEWTNSKWVNFYRATYSYDANGNMLTEVDELWTSGQWVNSWRYTQTYDVNGRLLIYLSERWTNNQWENLWRWTYTCDANGNVIAQLIEVWTNNRWGNSWRSTSTYGANGGMLTELDERWTNEQWVNEERYTYTYDASGNCLTELCEEWSNNQWVNDYHYTWTCDANGNWLTELYERWTNNQWVNTSLSTYTYDANGRMLTGLTEVWTNNQWENSALGVFTYDVHGNMEMGLSENWQGGTWVPWDATFSLLDSAGNYYYWSPAWKVVPRYRHITTEVAQGGSELPTQYALMQNYPNPFNPSTTIEYSLPERASVEIKVLDVLGREVMTLLNEENPAGAYTVRWNADGVASGVYFYRLQAGGFLQTRKLLLLR